MGRLGGRQLRLRHALLSERRRARLRQTGTPLSVVIHMLGGSHGRDLLLPQQEATPVATLHRQRGQANKIRATAREP